MFATKLAAAVLLIVLMLFQVVLAPRTEAAVADVYYWPSACLCVQYEGRVAGFLATSDGNGTQWMISTEPVITDFDPATTVFYTTVTYEDVVGGAPVNWDPAQYSRIASAIHEYWLPEIQALPQDIRIALAGHLNIGMWNLVSPGSVPYPPPGHPLNMGGVLDGVSENIVANLLSGAYDTSNWAPWGELLRSGPEEFFLSYEGTIPDTISTPIPPSLFLFAGGLLGLVAVARRKKF